MRHVRSYVVHAVSVGDNANVEMMSNKQKWQQVRMFNWPLVHFGMSRNSQHDRTPPPMSAVVSDYSQSKYNS